MKSVSLPVSQVEKLTSDSVKVSFKIPQEHKISFDFFAGQYITLEKEIEGMAVRRAYSICSSPYEDIISVAIKQVPNGVFSTYACKQLQEGETLGVFLPEGKFAYIPEISPENLGLFAAGSGITPMLSIIKVALAKSSCKILLVYGNRTPETTMFLSDIEALRGQYPDRLLVQYVYSKTQQEGALSGHIDPPMVEQLLKETYKEVEFGRFYICGPQSMVEAIKEKLLKDYDKKKIHTELFTVTQTSKKEYKGTSEITVRLENKEYTFIIERKENILSQLLAKGLEVSYSCLTGACSSCLGKVTEGSAEMDKNQVLSEEEIAKGMILTCQAHPTSQQIRVEFDY